MKLQIKREPTGKKSTPKAVAPSSGALAEIRVISVARVSAVCEVLSSTEEVKVGDVAFLGEAEIEKAMEQKELGSTRKYPQVITFTEGGALEEEARAFVPRPPFRKSTALAR